MWHHANYNRNYFIVFYLLKGSILSYTWLNDMQVVKAKKCITYKHWVYSYPASKILGFVESLFRILQVKAFERLPLLFCPFQGKDQMFTFVKLSLGVQLKWMNFHSARSGHWWSRQKTTPSWSRTRLHFHFLVLSMFETILLETKADRVDLSKILWRAETTAARFSDWVKLFRQQVEILAGKISILLFIKIFFVI